MLNMSITWRIFNPGGHFRHPRRAGTRRRLHCAGTLTSPGIQTRLVPYRGSAAIADRAEAQQADERHSRHARCETGLAKLGFEPGGGSSGALAQRVDGEIKKWTALVREKNIHVEP